MSKDVSIPEAGRRQEQRRAAGGIGRLMTLYYCYYTAVTGLKTGDQESTRVSI